MKHFESALELSNKVRGENHPESLVLVSALAECCINTGNYEGAERYARIALKGFQKTLGKSSIKTLCKAYDAVYALFRIPGRKQEAEELAKETIKAYEQTEHSKEEAEPDQIQKMRSYLPKPAGESYYWMEMVERGELEVSFGKWKVSV